MFAELDAISAQRNDQVRVKVCGLTCPADAELALELGADALGFNFYPGSPRCLDLEKDATWIRKLPTKARKVAVAVNPTREQIDRWLQAGVADIIQLHGDENAEFCAGLREANIPFVKAIRVRDESALLSPERFCCSTLLLDAYQPQAYGGTGHRVDWMLAARFTTEQRDQGRNVILSGGLKPDNISDAIKQVQPAGVDVASGVEGAMGPLRKDPKLLQEFFAAVQRAK